MKYGSCYFHIITREQNGAYSPTGNKWIFKNENGYLDLHNITKETVFIVTHLSLFLKYHINSGREYPYAFKNSIKKVSHKQDLR